MVSRSAPKLWTGLSYVQDQNDALAPDAPCKDWFLGWQLLCQWYVIFGVWHFGQKTDIETGTQITEKTTVFQLTWRFGGTVSTKRWLVCRCLQWIRNLSTFRLFVLPSSIQPVVRPYLSKSIFAPMMSTNRTVVQHLYKTCSRICSWFYCEPFIWIIVLRICRKLHTYINQKNLPSDPQHAHLEGPLPQEGPNHIGSVREVP